MITLTTTPVIKTNSKEGSQFASNSKKPYILDILLIPATMSPRPNTTPIRKSTNFAITDFYFSEYINKSVPTRESPMNP